MNEKEVCIDKKQEESNWKAILFQVKQSSEVAERYSFYAVQPVDGMNHLRGTVNRFVLLKRTTIKMGKNKSPLHIVENFV